MNDDKLELGKRIRVSQSEPESFHHYTWKRNLENNSSIEMATFAHQTKTTAEGICCFWIYCLVTLMFEWYLVNGLGKWTYILSKKS